MPGSGAVPTLRSLPRSEWSTHSPLPSPTVILPITVPAKEPAPFGIRWPRRPLVPAPVVADVPEARRVRVPIRRVRIRRLRTRESRLLRHNPARDLVVTVTGRHVDSFTWRPALIQSGLPDPRVGGGRHGRHPTVERTAWLHRPGGSGRKKYGHAVERDHSLRRTHPFDPGRPAGRFTGNDQEGDPHRTRQMTPPAAPPDGAAARPSGAESGDEFPELAGGQSFEPVHGEHGDFRVLQSGHP